jgi:hypothetical protein
MIIHEVWNNFQAAGYSVTGRNHAEAGAVNQDSIKIGKCGQGGCFMVLADGVSSAAHAKEGSSAAVEVVSEIAEQTASEIICSDPGEIRRTIVRRWKNRFQSCWNDYATTLNFIVACSGRLIAGQIGDGIIAINADGKELLLAEESEFYTTETTALCEAVRQKDFRLKVVSPVRRVSAYLASDGIGKEISHTAIFDLGKYLEELLQKQKHEIDSELIPWIEGLDRKNGDDKTIGFLRWECQLW